MKKIILILFLFSIFLLAGCTKTQPSDNSKNGFECVAKDGQCCKGDECAVSNVQCVEDTTPLFSGCDQNCVPIVTCDLSQDDQQVNLQLKEFTVEADDLGLYPDELTVNKGDVVKITFKVRNEKVYYGGLDFRSSVFNTDTILPGQEATVEFTAQDTFTYTSYWPATNKLKATGTINVF